MRAVSLHDIYIGHIAPDIHETDDFFIFGRIGLLSDAPVRLKAVLDRK